MLIVELNEKIRVIRIPKTYEDFKKAVIEEYSLPKEKLSKIFFTYLDEENNSIYVTNEDDFLYTLPFIETIVFNIEFKENENEEKEQPSIDSLLLNGDIDAIIEKANKKIIELKNESKALKGKEIKLRSINKNKNNKIHIIHKGVNCNECKNIIEGIRYKCCICPDYNLCEKCENKFGLGHNHPLLKIRKPELCPIAFSCKLK